MEKKSIGEYISALRKVNGLTQKELGEKLNVTDKAVSRWENGDSYPDLAQIPVMAEIFGVTCDEILAGEKKGSNNDVVDSQSNARSKKRAAKIAKDTLNRFENFMYISMGLIVLGMIASLICNFAFLKGGLGFLLYLVFMVAGVFCQIVFTNNAMHAVDQEDIIQDTSGFKIAVMLNNKKFTKVLIYVTAFVCPLALLVNSVNAGMELIFMLGIDVVACTLAFVVNQSFVERAFYNRAVKRELFDVSDKKVQSINIKTKTRISAIILAFVLTCVVGSTNIVFMEMKNELFGRPIVFTDVDKFVEYMQTPTERNGYQYEPDMDVAHGLVGDGDFEGGYSDYYNAKGEKVPNALLYMYEKTLEDIDGNVIAEYYQFNEDVSGHTVSWVDGKIAGIEVRTYSMRVDTEIRYFNTLYIMYSIYAVLLLGTIVGERIIEKKRLKVIA